MQQAERTACAEYSLALSWGLVELNEISNWADEKILASKESDDLLTELSLAEDKKEAFSVLNQMAVGGDFWLAARKTMHRILLIDGLTPKEALHYARKIYDLGMMNDAPGYKQGLMHHWDYIDLAIRGSMGAPEEALSDFIIDLKEVATGS